MSKKLRVLSFLLVLILISTAVVGCDSSKSNDNNGKVNNNENKNDANDKADIIETTKLTYWVSLSEMALQELQSQDDNPLYQEIQKMLNVDIEFMHPTLGQEDQQFAILISSNDLPDIIELKYRTGDLYPGGPDKAVADGVFLKLNDIIEKYSPNYSKIINSTPEFAKQSKTDSGNIWAYNMVETKVQPAFFGPTVRKDWLDELGFEIPTTMDEWYVVLTAFKNEKGATAPMLLDKSGVDPQGVWVSAYGVAGDFIKKDDKVLYGPMEEGFREYLKTMKMWYEEGLIDPDFVSGEGDRTVALKTSGKTGAFKDGFWTFESTQKKSEDPNMELVGAKYPVLIEGDEAPFRQYNENVRGNPACITPSCENIEAAAKLLDFGYSEKGILMCNYGVEGLSYNLENGEPVLTDYMVNNEDGHSFHEMMHIAALHQGPYVRDWELPLFSFTDIELGAMNEMWAGDNSANLPNSLTLTAEESQEFSSKMNDIKTYTDEMVVGFIMGTEPIEDFDMYVENLKEMQIEKMISIKQNALDRYNKR